MELADRLKQLASAPDMAARVAELEGLCRTIAELGNDYNQITAKASRLRMFAIIARAAEITRRLEAETEPE